MVMLLAAVAGGGAPARVATDHVDLSLVGGGIDVDLGVPVAGAGLCAGLGLGLGLGAWLAGPVDACEVLMSFYTAMEGPRGVKVSGARAVLGNAPWSMSV